MKKFVCLAVVIVVVAMFGAFVGTLFANSVFANANKSDSVQTVVATPNVVTSEATVEPTSEPTAEPVVIVEPTAEATTAPESTIEPTSEPTVEPVAVEATVEPTATPIAEAISEDPSQISWTEFFKNARYSDDSFNAVNVGDEAGRINFTDEDLMAHVGEEIAINVASRSVSVKFENVEHTKYESTSVKSPDLSACKKHAALARRHSRAYGDNITIKLTADDITNIATYAAYWYDKTGKLTYGFVVCGCANGAGSGSNSSNNSGSSSNDNGGNSEPTEKPVETPRPAVDNTPVPPVDEATNNPGHNDQVEPQPATKNTPAAPTEEASNNPAHNDVVNSNAGAGADESNNNPSHSDLPGAEEASESTASAVADAGSAPAAPSTDLVASIASNDAPPAPAEDLVASISSQAEESNSSAPEAPAPVVEVDNVDTDEATNVPSFSDMPTE